MRRNGCDIRSVGRPDSGSRCEVKAGDTILFGNYAGCEVTGAHEERPIMPEEDVLGILQ